MKKLMILAICGLAAISVAFADDAQQPQACMPPEPTGGTSGGGAAAQSCDPNEISGPLGAGEKRYVQQGEWMNYTIYFENKTNATAAAQEVFVDLPMDPNLDWSTLELGEVVFGEHIDTTFSGKSLAKKANLKASYPLPGTNTYVKTTVTMKDGVLSWYIRDWDPTTKDNFPASARGGFLPPNDETGRGEGRVSFRVKVKVDAPRGATIRASAQIVFDDNPMIETDPSWFNTVAEPAKVAFNANGGTGTMAAVEADMDGKVTLPANKFTRSGYKFAGWATSPSGAVVYKDKWSGTLSAAWGEKVALYAKWTAIPYTVKFSANGGKGTMAAQAIARDKSVALSANKFTKSGCTFLGWAKTKTGKVAYANKASVKNLAAADKSVTLYAQWAVSKYTIKFNAYGGKLPKGKKMSAQTMTYGKAAKLRKNVFTKKGYVFAGWATSKANAKKGVIAYKNAQSVKNVRVDGKTTTLYAVWAKPKYKVAFYANGGKGATVVQTLKYGKAAKLAKCKFVAPKGKKFAGWATSAANAKAGKVKYKNAQAVKNLIASGKTVKLYAVWKKK